MLSVNIQKSLGDFHLDVSFESGAGVTGILGASGCGKSMTLRCIAGIEKPDEGYIIFNDTILFDSKKRINVPPQKRKVGYLFQHYALFPNMSVKKNILCGLHGEKNTARRHKECDNVLQLLQLEGLENHRPSQLSGGQAQRTALARILVNRPRLLMLDEPFSAIDSHLRQQLQSEMKLLLEQYGGMALLVTHSRDEADYLCDCIAHMESGRILTLEPITNAPAAPASSALTHFDSDGNAVMVDISGKNPSARRAVAKGSISVNAETMTAVRSGTAKKGDVLGVARIAGISAAKRTADLIPLCHPLIFDNCTIDFDIDEKNLQIEAACTVKLSGKTGAEMEALTGVSVALLTIYDMCKAIDKNMLITNVRLC